MRIISSDAVSLNGKLTKGGDADSRTWTSPEDARHLRNLIAEHDVLIMGRTTYDMVHPDPEPGRLRLVLTHHPEEYDAKVVAGQLEFVDASVTKLVQQLKRRGYKRALLLGGQVNTQFWNAGLVDEAYLTFEPLIFSQGRNLLQDVSSDKTLRLVSIGQLNKRGTLLAHYLVEK